MNVFNKKVLFLAILCISTKIFAPDENEASGSSTTNLAVLRKPQVIENETSAALKLLEEKKSEQQTNRSILDKANNPQNYVPSSIGLNSLSSDANPTFYIPRKISNSPKPPSFKKQDYNFNRKRNNSNLSTSSQQSAEKQESDVIPFYANQPVKKRLTLSKKISEILTTQRYQDLRSLRIEEEIEKIKNDLNFLQMQLQLVLEDNKSIIQFIKENFGKKLKDEKKPLEENKNKKYSNRRSGNV